MKLVYVLNKKGKPLMPTSRCGHVRWLIKTGKAVVINNNPFTIRLKYEVSNCTQQLTLGIDPGRENIGLSVSNDQGDCLFQAVVKTNNKLSELPPLIPLGLKWGLLTSTITAKQHSNQVEYIT